jgi:DNA polymerase-3 subunit beta
MKIDIEKKDLLSLLVKTQNIVEKRNTMAVLVNVLLDADKNVLQVFATDLEVSLTDSCSCKVHAPGKLAVNAKNLFEIIKELFDGPLTLIKKENNWLEIKQGKYTSKIVGISSDEYPIFPTSQLNEFIEVDAQLLKDMIDKTIYSVSNDDTRYHLNGVLFEVQPEKGFRMVATDGHRMSLVNKDFKTPHIQSFHGVIIPRKGIHEIRKLIESVNGKIQISIEGSQFVLKCEKTIVMVRLIEGKYPNYQQFIPQKINQKLSLNREILLSSFKRVALLANQKSKAVLFSISKGKIEISSNNPEMGDAREEIEVDYQGQDMKIGFNAKYIQDILNSIQDEKIDFEINDQLSPTLMRPHDDKNYTCIVMPMRI